MNCWACECGEGREADSFVMRETSPAQPLQFVVAGRSIQHPQKAALKCTNADAFAADQNVIGIADGVSTVEDEGLDPSELPIELLGLCLKETRARALNSVVFDAEAEESLHACDVDVATPKLPLYILTKASVQCKSYGSTTCVLALLDECKLWSVNIGDSQLLVLRRTDTPPKAYPAAHEFSYTTCHDSRGRVPNPEEYGGYQVVYRTVSQQHFFNCPFQFVRMPDTDCSGEAILRKTAETADRAVNAGQPPPGVSWPVVTPFSKAAFDEVGRRFAGGKPDDITAVVAYIVPSGEAPAEPKSQPPLKRSSSSPARTPKAQAASQKARDPGGCVLNSVGGEGSKQERRQPQGEELPQVPVQMMGLSGSSSRSSFPPRNIGVVSPAIKASIHSVPQSLKPGEYTVFERLKEKAQQRLHRATSVRAVQENREGVARSWSAVPAAFGSAFRNWFSAK
ncbi:T-cell activation protein phosphatase 2C, putative [Eimeria brunetti]|uniref:Protein phosphatase n=1 Tax=Eimeria brunetti TaxID=51314 RepID=U6LYH6_9EIME|nr:T-cell activation protein phosphatase 2C, putative [Eimeria brunetti]